MLLASILGLLAGPTMGSLGDRYRAHRGVYLLSLLLCYLSSAALLSPMLAQYIRQPTPTPAPGPCGPGTELEPAQWGPLPDGSTGPATEGSSLGTGNGSTPLPGPIEWAFEEAPGFKIDQQLGSWWLYFLGLCLALAEMSATVNMTLSDSFTSNVARKCGQSYGPVRVWGALGWVCSSLLLLTIDHQLHWLPFLAPAFGLSALLATCNILLVACWPDKRPFDLAEEELVSDGKLDATQAATGLSPLRFKLAPSFRLSSLLHSSSSLSRTKLELQTGGQWGRAWPHWNHVELIRVRRLFAFDGRDEDLFRNVRRCSLAPLGDSYVIKQFELSNGSPEADTRGHFNFVAKIEPACDKRPPVEQQVVVVVGMQANGEANAKQRAGCSGVPRGAEEPAMEMSFRLHLKILQLIAKRKPNMLRFMLLLVLIGFILQMNLIYLLPFLESLEPANFRRLAAYVMVSGYLSESLFYLASTRLTKLLGHSASLTLVLLVFVLRYSFYLALALWPNGLAVEWVIPVELLQSLNSGWFYCVYNESALSFALEAAHCLPELSRLGLLDDSSRSRELLAGGVKLTLLTLWSCCFDGLGMAAGSLAGGYIIDRFGFASLWLSSAGLALAGAAANWALDASRLFGSPTDKARTVTN